MNQPNLPIIYEDVIFGDDVTLLQSVVKKSNGLSGGEVVDRALHIYKFLVQEGIERLRVNDGNVTHVYTMPVVDFPVIHREPPPPFLKIDGYKQEVPRPRKEHAFDMSEEAYERLEEMRKVMLYVSKNAVVTRALMDLESTLIKTGKLKPYKP